MPRSSLPLDIAHPQLGRVGDREPINRGHSMSEWFDTQAFAASPRTKHEKRSLRKVAAERGPGAVSSSTLSLLH